MCERIPTYFVLHVTEFVTAQCCLSRRTRIASMTLRLPLRCGSQWAHSSKKYVFFSHRFCMGIYRQLPPGSNELFWVFLAYWKGEKKFWIRIHPRSEVIRRRSFRRSIQGVKASSRYVFSSSDLYSGSYRRL